MFPSRPLVRQIDHVSTFLRQPGALASLAVLSAIAALMQLFGGYWDVSWHRALGRETFFSPPHLLLYAGVLAALFTAMLSRGARVSAPDSILGSIRHGLWIAALGPIAQLIAAPFDELWHRLYGLDVTLWSPPHLLLLAGMGLAPLGFAIALGEARRIEADGRVRQGRDLLMVLLLGLALAVALGVLGQLERQSGLRSDPELFVQLLGWLAPPLLVAARLLVPRALAATAVAAAALCVRLLITGVLALSPLPEPPLLPPLLLLSGLGVDAIFLATLYVRRRAHIGSAAPVALALLVGGGAIPALSVVLESAVAPWLVGRVWDFHAERYVEALPTATRNAVLGTLVGLALVTLTRSGYLTAGGNRSAPKGQPAEL